MTRAEMWEEWTNVRTCIESYWYEEFTRPQFNAWLNWALHLTKVVDSDVTDIPTLNKLITILEAHIRVVETEVMIVKAEMGL